MSNPIEYSTPNSIAAIWSMMLPGLGQMMKGRIMVGVLWAALVASGYFSYFWPGMILHGLCILDVAFTHGEGSLKALSSWPKRISYVGVIISLVVYIVARNDLIHLW